MRSKRDARWEFHEPSGPDLFHRRLRRRFACLTLFAMPAPSDPDRWIVPLETLLSRFIARQIDEQTFRRELPPAIAAYEAATGERATGYLHDLTGPLHFTTLRRRSGEAVQWLHSDALMRSTRLWIAQNLIFGVRWSSSFDFFGDDRQSLFGRYARLHQTPIAEDSFLYSSLAGVTRPLPFAYRDLLATLREVGGGEPAVWAYGLEPDGAFADVRSIWPWGDVYDEVRHLSEFEYPRQPEERGGYLMLLPKSRAWMLIHTYGRDFSIGLHGSEAFITEVANRIGATPTWCTAAED